MLRKTSLQSLPVQEEIEIGRNESGRLSSKKKTVPTPINEFQSIVSTITMARSLRNRDLLRAKFPKEDLGEFYMSHATSPYDIERQWDTTTQRRTDVISRLNASPHFLFTTTPTRKFQV